MTIRKKTCSRGHSYQSSGPCPVCWPGRYKKKNVYRIRAKVWLYPGPPDGGGSWHFVTLPKKQSAEITKLFGILKQGWGSLPVVATLGKTSWKTSIFPDKKRGGYLLPLKAEVRKKEGIKVGDTVTLHVEIRV